MIWFSETVACVINSFGSICFFLIWKWEKVDSYETVPLTGLLVERMSGSCSVIVRLTEISNRSKFSVCGFLNVEITKQSLSNMQKNGHLLPLHSFTHPFSNKPYKHSKQTNFSIKWWFSTLVCLNPFSIFFFLDFNLCHLFQTSPQKCIFN